jgi:hydrogenase maturation protease
MLSSKKSHFHMAVNGIPGMIYKCRPEDLLPAEEGPISLHEIGLVETLDRARKKKLEIDTVVIGVERKVIDSGMELSEEVKSKIPSIIEAALKES